MINFSFNILTEVAQSLAMKTNTYFILPLLNSRLIKKIAVETKIKLTKCKLEKVTGKY